MSSPAISPLSPTWGLGPSTLPGALASAHEADAGMASEREGPAEPHRLSSQIAWFLRHTSARLLVLNASVLLALRLATDGANLLDLGAIAVVATIWPLQEWAAHRWILHLKPRTLFGRTIDPYFARVHRAHHRRPWVVATTMLPVRVVLALIPVQPVWLFVFAETGHALTAMAAYAWMAVLYEWTHYLTHATYKPKSAFYRRIWRNHRLHHFKNEHRWFAFTFPAIDTWLGTDPPLSEVETSQTVRTLGVDEDDPLGEAVRHV